MKLTRYLKLAFNILVHSKLRSWLAIIGIVIGAASVIAILSLGEGMQQELERSLGGLGADSITITPGYNKAEGAMGGFKGHGGGGDDSTDSGLTVKNLTIRDIQSLKAIPNIAYIGGTVFGSGRMEYLSKSSGISVQGVDPQVWKYMVISDLESGRYLSQGDKNVIVVGSKIAKDLFEQDLQVNRQVTIEGVPFRIVGILEEATGFGGDNNAVYMPIDAARETIERIGVKEFHTIAIKVADVDGLVETEAAIVKKLMLVRAVTANTRDFTVSTVQALQETISQALGAMTLFLGAIAAVSLLVGAVGIANTMFTTVLQKTREIGIMKAIGAKNHTVMLIFLFNSAMIGLVGGIIGGLLGYALSKGLPMLLSGGGGRGAMEISTAITPELLGMVLGFSMFIGLVAGAIPAYRASRMNPVDSLRYV